MYANASPIPKPRLICHATTHQPANAHHGFTSSRRNPRTNEYPCPRASIARASGIPPSDSTCMCPACPHRHGAYAKATPATAAAVRRAPSCRTSAYGPRNANACSRTNMMLYRTSAAPGPVPISPAGKYPSSVSENV
jgi:hypothetical protein